jgi:hypothetical protein
MSAQRRGREWTGAEDATLRALWVTGTNNEEILDALPGRTWGAVTYRASTAMRLGRRPAPGSPSGVSGPPIGGESGVVPIPPGDPLLRRLRQFHGEGRP